jgi:hypothetical protein
MTISKTFLFGAAGLAMSLAAAAPAAAQTYYPQNNGGGIVGAIINSVTGGYGQYPMGNYGYQQVSQRGLVQQCAVATEQRLSGQYRGQGYGAYNGNGYQQGYGYQNQGGARVLGITSVERRGNGGLSVRGVATSGAYGQQAYGQPGYRNQQGYGANGQADLSFNCKVNARGQITDIKLARNAVRYNRGY